MLFALEAAAVKNKQSTEEIEKLKTLLYQPIDIEKTGGVTIDLVKLGGKAVQGAVQIGLSFIPGGVALGKIVEELQKSGTANLSEGALDAIQRERIKVHIEQIRFLEQFQDRFRQIVAETVVRNKNGRLVVFVDDLDRCLPEKAIEVLEAIKLFVDAPGCVFLLGLDAEVIARGVEIRYHDYLKNGNKNAIDGAKYIEKIIQLPFQIPPVEHSDMQDFVGGLSSNWPHPECPIVFAEGLGDNPRQIKRTVNVFLMLWSLAQKRKKKLQGVVKPVRLAKVVAIQTIYPELYNLLKEEPRYLRELEEYFLEDAGITKTYESIHAVPDKVLQDIESGKEKFVRLSVSDGEELIKKPELPPALSAYASHSAIRRILTLHSPEMTECNFSALTPIELRIYFTLTRRVEIPQITVELPREVLEPQMVKIPAGKFLMGSTKEQVMQLMQTIKGPVERWADWGQPQHEVELSEYFIGKYLVTNREYQAYIQEMQAKPPRSWDGENYPLEKGDHPVVYVSWDNAQAYCQWLSQKTSRHYRLPTEAEWEKAARGDGGSIYPWGDTFELKRANTLETNIGTTTPVGQFSQTGGYSPYGCADMAGNIWEWCNDWFSKTEYKTRALQTVKDPPGPQKGRYRIMRGGSFDYRLEYACCAYRLSDLPDLFDSALGFRLALSPSSPISES